MPTRRPRVSRGLASLALALTIGGFATSEVRAQQGGFLAEHNRRFYGPLYQERGYADSLGLRGHKRCENGGYYGPPQIYSRQYGTVAGYRTVPPFAPLRPSQPGSESMTYGY